MAAVGEDELAAQSRHGVWQIGDSPIHPWERHYQVAIADHVTCRAAALRALERRHQLPIPITLSSPIRPSPDTEGSAQGGVPGDLRPPGVPSDYRLLTPERIKETHHVADEMQQGVLIDRLRPVGLTIAAHVDRNGMESSRRQRGKLMPP